MTDKEILKALNQQRKEEAERNISRPAFKLYKELLLLSAGILFLILFIAGAVWFGRELSVLQRIALLAAAGILFVLTQTKNILLLLIFLYQKYAPASVRNACLFTPSCSEYMRISILKHGVWKGLLSGLKRLRRCHPPNGGIDLP